MWNPHDLVPQDELEKVHIHAAHIVIGNKAYETRRMASILEELQQNLKLNNEEKLVVLCSYLPSPDSFFLFEEKIFIVALALARSYIFGV